MSLKTICLVTNELHPVTHGGCGTLIRNSIFELLRNGYRVVLLADIKPGLLDSFETAESGSLINRDNLAIYPVQELLESSSIEPLRTTVKVLGQSHRYYRALIEILKRETIDVVEFPDYFGWAYFSLVHFHSNIEGTRPCIAIRYHLSMEVIEAIVASGSSGIDQFVLYQLERYSLERCDYVLMASKQVNTWIQSYYNLKWHCVESTPSFEGMEIEVRRKTDAIADKVLFYARLAPQKGAELFIDAAVLFLDEVKKARSLTFVVAGPDMYTAPGGGFMTDFLKLRIPERYKGNFYFPGNLNRKQWNELLPQVSFAVAPTRIETYCYAVRELLMAGVPTIVSDIPAFEDLIVEKKCIATKLELYDLCKNMQKLFADDTLRDQLSEGWQPSSSLSQSYKKLQPQLTKWQMGEAAHKREILLTVIILCPKATGREAIARTIESINLDRYRCAIWLAQEDPKGAVLLMGKRCRVEAFNDGKHLSVGAMTNETLCLLQAGDLVPSNYFRWALDMLGRSPLLGVVGCATKSGGNQLARADTFPWDAAPEVLPFNFPGHLWRFVIRSGKRPLIKHFEQRLLYYQEIDAMWNAIGNEAYCLRRSDIQIQSSLSVNPWVNLQDDQSNIALHVLLTLHMNRKSRLRLAHILKAFVYENKRQTIYDLLKEIRRSGIGLWQLIQLAINTFKRLLSSLFTRIRAKLSV